MQRTATLFSTSLTAAAFLCTTTFGFVLTWAIIVMPGIAKLDDEDFLRAFQVMDGIIQDNQPVFVLMWVGAVLTLLVACTLGISQLRGQPNQRIGLAVLTVLYMLSQVTTAAFNVPMNNTVQGILLDSLDDTALQETRSAFETPWIFWNDFRCVLMGVVSIGLLTLLQKDKVKNFDLHMQVTNHLDRFDGLAVSPPSGYGSLQL